MISRLSAKPMKIGPFETLLLYSIAGPKSLPPFQTIPSIYGNVGDFKFCFREYIKFIGGTVAEPSQFEHSSNSCTISGIKTMSLFQISILIGGSSAPYLPQIYWSLQGITHIVWKGCVCESVSCCHVWWKWHEANVFIFLWISKRRWGGGFMWPWIISWGGKIIVIVLVII